ncbi:MAG TPA: site-specific integrase [Opitutaceae bacterium]|nr:site-specific integrase [Opitutaceae bacterium]
MRRKPRSSFWWACFYREDGSRGQRSTRLPATQANRKAAQRFADNLEEAHQKKATEGQMRRILSDLNERLVGQPLASATLHDFAAQWLARKKGELGHVSYAAYKSAINEFVEHTPAKAHLGLQYLTSADVAAFRDRSAAKASAKTANNKLKIVRTMLQTAWRDGYILENPAAKVSPLKTEDSIRRPFTMDELKKVLAIATDEWRGMVLVGLYTGQRLKDVATLRWCNVDLERNEITLTTSKTKRRQFIPLARTLQTYFTNLDAPDDPRAPVFPVSCALVEKDRDVGRLSQQFYELLVTAGLATARLGKDESRGVGRKGPRLRNELTFHSLRHTATSLLKNAGVSEAVARDIIGHDSEPISRHYTHIEASAMREAPDRLPDVLA